MKLAHLADVHLGFRQYHRLTSKGINQREQDVATAFRRTIDDVIAAGVDLVVVAGDLFHSVRPSNLAILDSFNQFRRLREALPKAPIVIAAGNHDTPRSVETGTILRLLEVIGDVHVVAEEPRELVFRHLDLSAMCVPHYSWRAADRPRLVPGTAAAFRVAVTHREVAGVLPPESWSAEYGGAPIEPAELHSEEWSYVALGHFHVAHPVRANAWYAGALDYVSPNPWGELRDEQREGRPGQKGWLLVDLSAKPAAVRFRPVPLARRLVDLDPIHGAGLDARALDGLIEAAAGGVRDGIDDQIVRQVVYDVPRQVARDLNHALIRDLKARALHYHLDVRRPAAVRTAPQAEGGARRTLRDVLLAFVRGRAAPPGIDRDRLVALAGTYLEMVDSTDEARESDRAPEELPEQVAPRA